MSKKSLIALICAVLILAVGVYAMIVTAGFGPTYAPNQLDAAAQYSAPEMYDNSELDGVAKAIVNSDLDKTKAANVVSAVVFDYGGFDTLGESFILLTAISGAHVILHSRQKKREEGKQ